MIKRNNVVIKTNVLSINNDKNNNLIFKLFMYLFTVHCHADVD